MASGRRRSIALAAVVVVAVAACNPSVDVSPAPTSTPAATPVVSPSAVVPIASPSPTLSPTPVPTPTPRPLTGLKLELVARGIHHPIDVRARPDTGELWAIEQRGVVVRIEEGKAKPVLDLQSVVHDLSIEQGLLGLAFHPDFPNDPRVFVFHSKANNDNVLASYRLGSDPDVLDPKSRTDILTIDKERDSQRHNGGTLLFGPDGLLYLSVGDAARATLNGQDPANLPGSILRIDVSGADRYSIPVDNPFAAQGTPPVAGLKGAPEVWWFGFRNPWRFSIDPESGLAYIGDVGQERIEEIDVAPLAEPGLNFGWPVFEGTRRYSNAVKATSELTGPVLDIRHSGDRGCSVVGGEVYRGTAIPELNGVYFYADWCRGWIRSFRYEDGQVLDKQDWSSDLPTETVSSFGHDADGEILVLDWQADAIYRIVPVRRQDAGRAPRTSRATPRAAWRSAPRGGRRVERSRR
jgi:hypothetical protein